jgi:hypothetical protein
MHVTKEKGGPVEEASTFGILAMIAKGRPGDGSGTSPWAKDLGPSAMGNIFGMTIDDATGNGGLGLTNNGEGGGGKGEGIMLGTLMGSGSGTCSALCTGMFGHFGRTAASRVLTRREHIMMRVGDRSAETTVQGRLPPEAIQRIVRASFGRFRGCYEQGLQKDPSLEGRVAVKFVIARDGAVSMVSAADHSFADDSVAKCVARAFYNLSFPQPEGGIVTVVYPIVFSTST